MSEILKLPQLPQDDRVTEMEVGARRIDPELDAQPTSERELRPQFRFADNLGGALLKNGEGFVGLHGPRSSLVAGLLLTLVQQFAHLLDRERFILGPERLLA